MLVVNSAISRTEAIRRPPAPGFSETASARSRKLGLISAMTLPHSGLFLIHDMVGLFVRLLVVYENNDLKGLENIVVSLKTRNIYTNDKDFLSYMCKKQRLSLSARFSSLHSIIIIPLSIIFCYLTFIIIADQLQSMAGAALMHMSTPSAPSNVTISNNNTNMTRTFHHSYETLINDSRLLTQNYQSEISKWRLKQYDNKTMMSITDNYLPMFQKLVGGIEALKPSTDNYIQAKEWYIKSLQSEIESYRHFRNFLENGSPREDEKSTQLLSDALRYEFNSFAAFNNQTNNQAPFV